MVLIIASCQHTQAAEVEEEPTEATTEVQLECFKYVEDIPLPVEFQTYINKVAKSYEIAPEIVFSMIEKESAYDTTATSDNGDSEGLMQVQRKHHEERMSRLGCTDLFDPYKNVLVGVDYLAELLTHYEGNIEMALTAYNAGPSGAYEHYFSHGIEANEYAEAVIENSKKIEEGMVLVFYRTDNPVADFTRYDAEQQKELEKCPKCSECSEYIQDEHYYEINDEVVCEECLNQNFRKNTDDFND
jgi:SLT domain-containing protein